MSELEKEVAKIEKYNQEIIDGFKAWLEKENLSAKTIKNHIANIEFFAEYLVYYEPSQQLDEADDQDIYDFLLNYFPRKAMWASESSTKSYMGSFKKFFSYMLETNKISPDIEAEVKDTLKEGKQEFLDAVSD
ncbi:phage integrase N-terminal SAM-like domain-containing protein [Anabaena sphaerica FACHB-251]|uniref:Phage integrase N-terminal SAM-like domain-containing protein n=1 Tax=Anabaena sphaerica FACHB-251 TaxID=2692883 RepID=A0A926WIA8_9NOST|nr:site-specific integrase [Anabaena sphaerica]MBD2295110.1 phage integrase N-terminal SAM-like domain-containing protein [Anabaena sphaerica FACHB-251]